MENLLDASEESGILEHELGQKDENLKIPQKSYWPALMVVGLFVAIYIGMLGFGLKYVDYQFIGPEEKLPVPLTPTVCTKESKSCPDGTAVGRSGPNCEFAPCPVPTVTETQSSIEGNTYTNFEYGISFLLLEGERVVECPNVNEFNHSISIRFTDAPPIENGGNIECASEGSSDAIVMSKKSSRPMTIDQYISLLEGESYNYVLTTTPVEINGVSGIKVVGSRDTSIAAPLPETIDQMLFERNSIFYNIPSSYIDRDFTFLN